tara:strand:- start:1770 stop:2315 length:546 start_codon:yes stop_codon:yes gene_type:complete
MKQLIILFLGICPLVSRAQTVEVKEIQVEPYLVFQNYEHFKRLCLSSPNSAVEFIEDFDFAWGYQYQLKVEETILESALSDGTEYEFRLVEVLSKTKVADSTEATLFLDSKRYYQDLDNGQAATNDTFKMLNDSTYLYFDAVVIEVPQKLQAPFQQILRGEKSQEGHFVFLEGNRIRLVKL